MSKVARELLEVWFEGCAGSISEVANRRWFSRDDGFDALLRQRFGSSLELAARGQLGSWCITPHGSLAFVILCDQVARNIHRASAFAFATDALALHESLAMIGRGHDRELTVAERHFVLMPLMHSEDLAIHDLAIRQFTRLRDEAPPETRAHAEGALGYEAEHRSLIERFGRFPQRNEALGRSSSEDERAFLSARLTAGSAAST